MPEQTVSVKVESSRSEYRIRIGAGVLGNCGTWARGCLGHDARRVVVISNSTVYGLYGERTVDGLGAAGFEKHVHLIGDGERYKSFRTLEHTLAFLSEKKLSRTDAVLALGGGVVGDLAGFASSVYLRGIAYLQVPTTLLSMIDSSVGGKTGINSRFGKNLIGSFYQPSGVLIDVETLNTLPRRELTAGLCEAVKQGAISGKPLFEKTAKFLATMQKGRIINMAGVSKSREPEANRVIGFIASQIGFKARIVEGDARESAKRRGPKSRKILNFGHTFGHALEKVTSYKRFRHGEAVGHGIIFASRLSEKLELLGKNEVKLLNDVVRSAGRLPALHGIAAVDIQKAFDYDKKQVNNSLQWILLKGIGKPTIVTGTDIPPSVLRATIREILDK